MFVNLSFRVCLDKMTIIVMWTRMCVFLWLMAQVCFIACMCLHFSCTAINSVCKLILTSRLIECLFNWIRLLNYAFSRLYWLHTMQHLSRVNLLSTFRQQSNWDGFYCAAAVATRKLQIAILVLQSFYISPVKAITHVNVWKCLWKCEQM